MRSYNQIRAEITATAYDVDADAWYAWYNELFKECKEKLDFLTSKGNIDGVSSIQLFEKLYKKHSDYIGYCNEDDRLNKLATYIIDDIDVKHKIFSITF